LDSKCFIDAMMRCSFCCQFLILPQCAKSFGRKTAVKSIPNSHSVIIRSMCNESNSSSRKYVTSLQNPRVKLARALVSNRKRKENGKFALLEGYRLILDAMQYGNVQIHTLFIYQSNKDHRSGVQQKYLDEILDKGSEYLSQNDQIYVDRNVLMEISDTATPQGVVAIVCIPKGTEESEETSRIDANFVLVCDEIREPGNLGTLLRSAAAAGVDSVLCTKGCVDIWNLKVLRAGMGAHFHLNIQVLDRNQLLKLVQEQYHCRIYVADSNGDQEYFAVDWTQPSALIVGSEANGPHQESIEAANSIIRIPMTGENTESLNASVAASIILFEAQRQRILSRR